MTVTVELTKPHTHAGREYMPGARLIVDEATARWLIDHGVAKPAPSPTPATPNRKPHRKGD